MQDWKALIDKAAEICGGQNALARKIGATQGSLASCKAGKRAMPKAQLEALAAILNTDASELWTAQELANMPRRNPFLRAAATAAACLVGGVVLSASLPSDAQASTLDQSSSCGDPSVYYVKLIGRLFRRLRAFFQKYTRAGNGPFLWPLLGSHEQ